MAPGLPSPCGRGAGGEGRRSLCLPSPRLAPLACPLPEGEGGSPRPVGEGLGVRATPLSQRERGGGEGQVEAWRRMIATGPELVRDALAAADIRLAASLPDDWLSDLIRLLERDPRFIHVAVAREAEAVGICSGAFF